jgi:hypothetical protein
VNGTVPAFSVPALLVTHHVVFVVLLRFWPRDRAGARPGGLA